MACTYIYEGKKYNAWEFADVLASMPIDDLVKYLPGAVAAQLSEATQASRLGYDVQARKKAYTDDRQLQLFLDSEPDPSQTGTASDRARREAVASVDDLRSTGTVLGQSLSGDYAARQRVSLVGQKVSDSEELAILAQVYRDPRFETFRLVFTDDSGNVVSQVGLTSRLPASATAIIGDDVDAYLKDIAAAAKSTGATGFYMLHNHPSGLSKPSSADVSLTQMFAASMPGIAFQSHVVIDTNEYSVIDRDGYTSTEKKDFGHQNPFQDAEWGGLKIEGPADVMAMAKKLQVDDGAITLIHTNAQNQVKSITTIPESVAAGKRAAQHIARAALGQNGANLFAVGRSAAALGNIGGMVTDSILVSADGTVQSLRASGAIRGGNIYPARRTPRVSPDTSAAFDYLRMPTQGGKQSSQVVAENQPEPYDQYGDPSPEEASTVEAGIQGKSPIEVAKWLEENAPRQYAIIAAKVREKLESLAGIGVDFGMEIVNVGDYAHADLSRARGVTYPYSVDGKTRIVVAINGKDMTGRVGMSYKTVLHELVHAATSQSIQLGLSGNRNFVQPVKDLIDVMMQIGERVSKNIANGSASEFELSLADGRRNMMQSPDEVLAWALSSSEAQAYLESIEHQGKSLWSRFVDAVRSALGLSTGANTSLSEVLRISEILLKPSSIAEILGVKTDANYSIDAKPFSFDGIPRAQQQAAGNKHVLPDYTKPDIVWSSQAIPDTITTRRLTEKQFYNNYVQHVDVRGRDGSAAETRAAIMRDGFKKGFGPNALLPHRAGPAGDVVSAMFRPKVGDIVYLAPKGSYVDTRNGAQIKEGWKPKPYEVITITEENKDKSAYELYSEAFDGSNPDIRRSFAGQSSATDPKSTVAASRERLVEAFGQSAIKQLESMGLLNIAQSELEAIDRAAQMYAEATGQSVEDVRNSMLASVRMSRAWHGSPYKFDKFSTDHMGKGDGAQAYGWGLYFADSKDVAEWYRRNVSGADGIVFFDGKPIGAGQYAMWPGQFGISRAMADRLNDWRSDVETGRSSSVDDAPASLRKRLRIEKQGSTYEVEIPSDDTMLLWDKPLSEQPDDVKAAIQKMPDRYRPLDDMEASNVFGERLYRRIENGLDSDKAASLYLKSIGITGIKYLDGQSRSAGEGNFNYVVFDDADVQIIDVKYSADGAIQGFYVPKLGKAFVVADNVAAQDMPAVVTHEVGVHMAMDGNPAMEKLAKQAANLIKLGRGNPFFDRIRQRMDEAGETSNEEAMAYLAEEAKKARDRVPNTVKQWLKDVVAAVKSWLFRKGVLGANRMNEADILAVATAYVKQAAAKNGEGQAKYSKSLPDTITIDGTNPDIRFSRSGGQSGGQQGQTPVPPEETRFQAAQRKAQDKLNRFTVIKEWLAEQGITLSELADVHKTEERMHSRFANKAEDFREKRVKPLVDKIQRAGFSMDDVAKFLHAQHAKERNDQIAKINKNMPDGGSGMTNAEAAAILAASSPELAALANELRSITVDTKNILLDSGLISKDLADAWDGAYQHYVPLKGGPDDEAGGKGTGKGLSVREKQRRALGHEASEDDTREDGEWIIENILGDHERALMQAEKNRVFQALLKMAIETSPLNLITINKPEKRQILKNQASYVVRVKGRPVDNFTTKEAANLFKQAVALSQKGVSPADITIEKTYDQTVALMASPMPGPDEATGYVNGQLVRVQFNDDLLARAYNNMGAESLGKILQAGRALNNYFSKIYTGYNPEFIFVNVIRDFTTGLGNVTGEEGIGMAMKSAMNYPKRFAELFRYALTGNETQWVKMYREDGGNTGAAYLSDLERLGSEIQTEYKAFQGVAANLKNRDYKGAARAAMRKVFDRTLVYIEHVNQAGENAMRLAVYQAMIESGRSRREAASLAKNVTVNFNRKGELGAQANALYLFFNASVQGTAAVAHAHFKGKHRAQAWGFSSAIIGMGYLLSLLAAEADEEEYEKTSEYERSRNILIPTGDGFVKIPVAFGYGFFWNFGRGMSDAQRTGDLGKTPWHIASSFVEEFTPFGAMAAGSGPDSEQAALYALPTIGQIAFSPIYNRTSMGIPMMPGSFNEHARARDLMNRNTRGTWADDLAGLLEDAGMDVSPETLKHYGRTFTGGAGMFVSSTVDGVKLKAQGAELDAIEIPFYRKLYTAPDVRGARARYYEAKSEADKALSDFKRAVKHGDMETANEIQAEQGELLALARLASKQKKRIKAARDRIDSIRLSGEYGKAAERHIIKNMEAEEEKIYDNYMAIFKAQTGR